MSILGRVFGSDSGEEYRELFKETQEVCDMSTVCVNLNR